MIHRIYLYIALFVGLFAIGAWIGEAAQAQGGSFSVAIVDLRRISSEYDGAKRSQDELKAYQNSLQNQITQMEDVRFLSVEERKEYDQLNAATNAATKPTSDQKNRIQALLNANKTRLERYRALQQTEKKSDAEKAEFDALSASNARTDAELDAMGGKIDQQLMKKRDELSDQLTQTVTAVIATAAKEKGYSSVMDKPAVLFGGTDITDLILQRLAKK